VQFEEFDEEFDPETDEILAAALAGIRAPFSLKASVMRRVHLPPPTRWPEFLDAVACMSVFAFAACFAFFLIRK
jgi:hypothetical protein